MKQIIKPGQAVEILTPEELIEALAPSIKVTRIRVPGYVLLDANGNGTVTVYTVPAGCRFEVRRVVLTLTGNAPSDPNTGNVALNAAGKFVAYLRGGSLIEYGSPFYCGAYQIPGAQTWGDQQGPELSNKEQFGVRAQGLTANTNLNVYVEGVLSGPVST